jgi:hypothetical protein
VHDSHRFGLDSIPGAKCLSPCTPSVKLKKSSHAVARTDSQRNECRIRNWRDVCPALPIPLLAVDGPSTTLTFSHRLSEPLADGLVQRSPPVLGYMLEWCELIFIPVLEPIFIRCDRVDSGGILATPLLIFFSEDVCL